MKERLTGIFDPLDSKSVGDVCGPMSALAPSRLEGGPADVVVSSDLGLDFESLGMDRHSTPWKILSLNCEYQRELS